MKTIIALLVKFALTLGAAWLAFSVFNNTAFSLVLLIAAFCAVLNYVIGDLFILPALGNILAIIADSGLSLVTSFLLITLSYQSVNWFALIIFAVGIGAGEYFFHNYLFKRKVTLADDSILLRKGNLNYRTETADELNPDHNNHKHTIDNNEKDDKGN